MNSTLSISDVSVPRWRQHVMRAVFLLNFIGLAPDNLSSVLFPTEMLDPMVGVAVGFWAAFSLLCLLGVRFPLKFTPLLLIQLLYKSAWLLGTYLPAYRLGEVDENLQSFFWSMAPGVAIDILIIPWRYVYREYLQNIFHFK